MYTCKYGYLCVCWSRHSKRKYLFQFEKIADSEALTIAVRGSVYSTDDFEDTIFEAKWEKSEQRFFNAIDCTSVEEGAFKDEYYKVYSKLATV